MVKCVKPRVVKCGDGQHRIVPCGQCVACRLNKVRDWTLRIMHEARFYKDNVFLTITYSPENLPIDGCIHKEDLQLFMKRLRKALGEEKIRFFACGEYGERYLRPHYHLILFGIGQNHPIFKGKKWDNRAKGYFLPEFKPWNKGIAFIGEVNHSTARYVASYVNKKQFGKKGQKWYKDNNLLPEFTLMSRRPGIGYDFVNFFGQCCLIISPLYSTAEKQHFPDIMKTKYGIPMNSKKSDKRRN